MDNNYSRKTNRDKDQKMNTVKAAPLAIVTPNGDLLVIMHICTRCATAYDIRKTSAVLRYTYCGAMCESADLGFSLEQATR